MRGGLVGLELLEKVQQSTYRLTAAGLAAAAEVTGAPNAVAAEAEWTLAEAMVQSSLSLCSWRGRRIPQLQRIFVLLAIFGMSRRGHRQTSFDVVLPTPIIRLRKRGYA